MNVLSQRLQLIANKIPVGARVADIGSDHAYLPTYLVQAGKSPFVIAGEVNDGPFQSACKQIKATGLEEQVHVRKGNGLAVIKPNEVDTIVIAGMGGSLIVQILTDGFDALAGIERLILQPNVGEELVRKYALEHGWELIDEEIVEEDDRIYEILSFVKGNANRPYENQQYPIELLLKVGPYLLHKKDSVFYKKWRSELVKRQQVIEQLKQATNPTATAKRAKFIAEYNMLKELVK